LLQKGFAVSANDHFLATMPLNLVTNKKLKAVYAFIAIPVQFWHHHSYANTDGTSFLQPDDIQKITFNDTSAKTAAGNCQVCSHHYSVHCNDDITVLNIVSPVFTPEEGFYVLTVPLTPYFNSANRGPPAAA
jgi:hypothetical protein